MPARFPKPPPALVSLFDEHLAKTKAQRRTMFGCPCGFVGGQMFTGLFGDQLFLRLSEKDRAELLAQEGRRPLTPWAAGPCGSTWWPRTTSWTTRPPWTAGWRGRSPSRALSHPRGASRRGLPAPSGTRPEAGQRASRRRPAVAGVARWAEALRHLRGAQRTQGDGRPGRPRPRGGFGRPSSRGLSEGVSHCAMGSGAPSRLPQVPCRMRSAT